MTSPEGVRIQRNDELAEQAYRMRMRGMDYRDIAEELQLMPDQVLRYIDSRMKRSANDLSSVEKQGILQLELDRLNKLQDAHWDHAMNGDPKSTDAILKIMALRAKLLQLDTLDSTATTSNVLVVSGESEEKFIAALNTRITSNEPDEGE